LQNGFKELITLYGFVRYLAPLDTKLFIGPRRRLDMSTKKEEKQDHTSITSSSSLYPTSGDLAQYQQQVHKALDKTKANIRRLTDKASEEAPHYAQAFNEYQEQTIQATKEIADNYIESQKEISDSLQSAWYPFVKNTYWGFWNYWFSPASAAELYALAVGNNTDMMIAATRLANNMVVANLEAFRTSIQQAKQNAKELSTLGVKAAKTFERTVRASGIGDLINPPIR
jgi:hypothetical protein